MHTAVMMAAVAVLGFFFRLLGSRGVLVPLGFGLAFGRACESYRSTIVRIW